MWVTNKSYMIYDVVILEIAYIYGTVQLRCLGYETSLPGRVSLLGLNVHMTTDISVITKSILATTSTPEEMVLLAYELGVSHGKSQEAQRRSKFSPKRQFRTCVDPSETLAINTKFRSDPEAHWFVWLTKRYGRVTYEPKKFPLFLDGKRTTYTPDFRCVLDSGHMIWVETKRDEWLNTNRSYWDKEFKQARAMQQVVKSNKLLLYVCTGKAGYHTTWQILGLDVVNPRDPSTLVRAELPSRTFGS